MADNFGIYKINIIWSNVLFLYYEIDFDKMNSNNDAANVQNIPV